ncbi:alpha/beta family hydrolase [Agromyces aurantiacus]|uniref:Alpha/beta family hydrolase n=1 Tax=Agromyces aurantiacus TaxID=165814 RepID=A0ABV9R5R8_9MICO|nr:alpha/beta family hydrolase [Agromyces aurantiacus]MBM7505992.1 putative alpha/beta-hydrolase family hydrolase [Agromyces aurantiacus]
MRIDEEPLEIEVGDGIGAVPAVLARPAGARATIVVAHGAGAGKDHPFLTGFSRALAELGFASLRFDFPYAAAGRRFPDRPPVAIATWHAATQAARSHAPGDEPVWASGKSFGGRMASMAAAEGMEVAGLAFLGYPLHPPGRPDRSRDEHFGSLVGVPMLFVQGRNDPFAIPNEQLDELVRRIGPSAVLEWIEGAGHSFDVKGAKRPAAEVGASLAPRVAAFVDAHGTPGATATPPGN